MFRVRPTESDRTLRLAILAVVGLSIAALAVTIWVMVDFLAEQKIVRELIEELPVESRAKAQRLEGELRWQFRLSMLIVLNFVVTGFAVVLLSRAYRSSQESLRDLKVLAADILDLGVLTTDTEGLVTSINRRGMEILGVNESCVGHPLHDLSEAMSGVRQQAVADGGVSNKQFPFVTDRVFRTLRASCQPLRDYFGKEIGNVLQLLDVTERILVDDRLRRMERYMGLGALAVGLHHEIKNPLAALSLHVQLLQEQLSSGSTSDDIQQSLRVIQMEVTRVGDVLESFRDFASIGELNLVPVDLADLIRRQVGLISPRAKQQGVSVVFRTSDGTKPKVPADGVRLEQVMVNLIVNALEAMPQGGQLTVELSTDEENAKIDVTDTGHGIPDDLRDKILDPYFTTKGEGTGLGLALCDKIMRQHNGSLDFHTSPIGTTFHVTLPLDPKIRPDNSLRG